MAGQGHTLPKVTVVQDLATDLRPSGRVSRRPQHAFQVEHQPWQIQPFMIAPVIPGETLENALLQVRAVSDPIKNPLIGWWLEHYIFYVKLTDLDDRDYFKSLMLSASATLASASMYDGTGTAVTEYYKAALTGYDYVKACLKRVTEEYFRDEDETWNGSMLSNLPLATTMVKESWMQSLSLDGTEETPNPLQGPTDPVWDDYLEQWQKMRELRLTDLTWEAWLASYGIRGIEVEKPHRPELIRYSRSWQYPSNTVDPSSGVPSSAVSWSVAERADKARFFKEPGFIFGVTVARPKVYFSKQKNYAAMFMSDAYSWLPAVMRDSPETSLRKFTSAQGPLAGNVGTNSYWVDMRDLLLYGDQFLNFALTETDNGLVALPGSALTKAAMRYPSQANDIEPLFTSAAGSGTKAGRTIRQDGVVALNVKGAQVDFT